MLWVFNKRESFWSLITRITRHRLPDNVTWLHFIIPHYAFLHIHKLSTIWMGKLVFIRISSIKLKSSHHLLNLNFIDDLCVINSFPRSCLGASRYNLTFVLRPSFQTLRLLLFYLFLALNIYFSELMSPRLLRSVTFTRRGISRLSCLYASSLLWIKFVANPLRLVCIIRRFIPSSYNINDSCTSLLKFLCWWELDPSLLMRGRHACSKMPIRCCHDHG
jgi:hypothetical protein